MDIFVVDYTLGPTYMGVAPNRRAPTEVNGPLISTGMGRGLHTWIATALTIAAVILGLFARSITEHSLALMLLAGGVGLVGEVPRLLRTGEVRARDAGKTNCFLVIRKDDSPVRFYFYIIIYSVLGVFSFLFGGAILALLLTNHSS